MTDHPRPAVAPGLLGAVLAGGEGRRFGAPKAGAPIAGIPMVRRAVAALSAVTSDVVVVSPTPVPEAEAPRVADRVPGKGPLGGLEAALREAVARGLDGVLLLACDLPLVGPELLGAVAAAAAASPEAPVVAPARDGGGVEPLCAVYRVGVLEGVTRLLASDDLSLHALFRDVGGRALGVEELGSAARGALLNVNTATDRSRAEDALRAGRHG
jgi:molybdenum cofactor guanylyltransferase